MKSFMEPCAIAEPIFARCNKMIMGMIMKNMMICRSWIYFGAVGQDIMRIGDLI